MTRSKVFWLSAFAACFWPLIVDAQDGLDAPARRVETIVYTTARPSNWDVFLFVDGATEPRRLTDHPAFDYNATFSPDGEWVVFTSERNGNADLFALELQTAALHQLTRDEAMDDAAAFSADGRFLTFVSTRAGSPDIYSMEFLGGKGSEPVVLASSRGNDLNPVFSPDGKQIAFSSNRETSAVIPFSAGLYVMNADGSDPRRIVTGKLFDGSPAWSPDGKRLFFNSFGVSFDAKPVRLYSISLDGTGLQEHTSQDVYSFGCTTHKDGTVAWTEAVDVPEEFNGVRFSIKAARRANWSNVTTVCNGYLRPRFDSSGKRMLCHGPGPVDDLPLMPNGNPLARPGAARNVKLPDRDIRVVGVRAYFPSLGPDGQTLIASPWVHARHGRPAGPAPILRASLDGTGMKTIFSSPDEDMLWSTVQSRDGRWLYFCKGPPMAKPDANVDIWRTRSDGSDAQNLTADCSANDAFPDVSADGNRVVFRSGREGRYQIFMMDGDGKNVQRVTDGKGYHTMPAVSPDGGYVVYSSQAGLFGSGGFRLFIKSLNEPNSQARLLEPELNDLARADMHPRFSPDGKWVVFTSSRGGLNDDWHNCGFYPQPYGDLWAAPVDGSCRAIRLTDDKWEDGLAYWAR
jgi:Tol biopolymer transport system component